MKYTFYKKKELRRNENQPNAPVPTQPVVEAPIQQIVTVGATKSNTNTSTIINTSDEHDSQ